MGNEAWVVDIRDTVGDVGERWQKWERWREGWTAHSGNKKKFK